MDNPPQRFIPAIRAARPDDAVGIAAMQALPGFRFGTLRLPHPRPEATRRWLEALPETSHVLVAEHEGRIAGMAGLDRFTGRRAHAGGLGMGVHDSLAGHGIGRALLGEIVDLADRWLGLRRLELTVFTDNARAIGLYRSFGFETEGTLRGFALRDGALADAYTMGRVIAG